MITHGNKQISEIVYARKASEGGGAVRITNIIRGAQVVFGDLIPRLAWQLLGATKAAILAAFGQTDGKAVIKATNAYLNALAATDPTKATALAGFINEDPMMVMSLIEGFGTRLLVISYGTGMPYIDTLMKGSLETEVEIDIIHHFTGNPSSVYDPLITGDGVNGIGISHYSAGPNWAIHFGNKGWFNFGSIISDREYNLKLNKTKCSINGSIRSIGATSYTSNVNIYLGKNAWGGEASSGNSLSYKRVQIKGSRDYVPFICQARTADKVSTGVAQAAGTCGMIDLLTGIFYPNVNTSGSFTIAYTHTDGTPWTPLNQTP